MVAASVEAGCCDAKGHYSNHRLADGGETGRYREWAVPPAYSRSGYFYVLI
jgi:hypothetical protein